MHRRARRGPNARTLAVASALLACAAAAASLLVATHAAGTSALDRSTERRVMARAAAGAKLARSLRSAPLARAGRCPSTADIPAVGRGCRTRGGMIVLPRRGTSPLLTHGPDLVDATSAARRARSVGFGTTASIICSAPSRTRHVVLAYLLPADAVTGGPGTRGDRSPELVPQLRQALLDAAATIDARAGELAPGSRRRLRVACEDDGQPLVERIVLPRTAAAYRADRRGFLAIERDLATMGALPGYRQYLDRRVPSVRRVLAYYDADFHPGVAGQGTLFQRTEMLRQGTARRDPLVSRTTRNINNNPPSASLGVVYGTSYGGVPDPPRYGNLLHELAHTMGAVQDEPATATDAGHCVDGLDVMCYDDNGPSSNYRSDVCADATPPVVDVADEVFDCNGDTYFHPAPRAGTALASPVTWQLGLAANETLAATTGTPARPRRVLRVRVSGRGTGLVLRWPRVVGAVAYDVGYRASGGTWEWMSAARPVAVAPLRERTDYEFAVAAVSRAGVTGVRARASRRTGIDTTRPGAVGRVGQLAATRTSVQLAFEPATDNQAVTRYRVEYLARARWRLLASFPAPFASSDLVARSPRITGLRRNTALVVRLRAQDARGNLGAPSRQARVATTR